MVCSPPMSSPVETVLASILILMAPMLLHLGALRGADFYPQKPTGKPLMDAISYRWLKPIIAVNGVLLSSAFLLWRLFASGWWVIPIVLFIPLAFLQVAALITAKVKDIAKR